MGFANIGSWVDADAAGRVTYSSWRKTPSQASSIGIWSDLSMSPGNPVPNYYASSPLISATLDGREGMWHGQNVTPGTKHLRRLMAMTATATPLPMTMILCDYLLYYPFVDMSTQDEQPLVQDDALPRYADGEGVQIMVVVTNAPSAPTALTFQMSYTNQDGTAGRTTVLGSFGGGVNIGVIGTTDRTKTIGNAGPFVTLQEGDTGVRSVETFTMISGVDVGLVAVVLVRPLAQHSIRGIDAPVEVDYLKDFPVMPRIVDGAYLNLIACPSGSLAAVPIHGMIETIWSAA